jgi:AraC-like DNA-binding protein
MPGTVSAKTVRAVLAVAKAAGIDAAQLARAHGLAAAISDVDARFPHAAWIAVWEDMIRQTNRDSLGIDAAESLPWGHWDVIDYLIGTSDTFGTALRRFERYFALISTGVQHVIEHDGDTVRLVRRYAPDCVTRLLAPAEFAFAATVAHMRIAVGFRWCPREVSFAAPAPSSVATHRRFFGCPVHFDALESALVIDASALTLPMQQQDSELGRVLERHADLLVKEFDGDRDFVSQVRRVIVNALPDSDLSIAQTARQLGMSVRTLQRRLQENDFTFDDLCDSVRGDLARRYLDDPTLSIQETAHLLAFRDLRGFYRAFKRWEGRTPAEYRQRRKKTSAGASRP